jgi:hypothetical protein
MQILKSEKTLIPHRLLLVKNIADLWAHVLQGAAHFHFDFVLVGLKNSSIIIKVSVLL